AWALLLRRRGLPGPVRGGAERRGARDRARRRRAAGSRGWQRCREGRGRAGCPRRRGGGRALCGWQLPGARAGALLVPAARGRPGGRRPAHALRRRPRASHGRCLIWLLRLFPLAAAPGRRPACGRPAGGGRYLPAAEADPPGRRLGGAAVPAGAAGPAAQPGRARAPPPAETDAGSGRPLLEVGDERRRTLRRCPWLCPSQGGHRRRGACGLGGRASGADVLGRLRGAVGGRPRPAALRAGGVPAADRGG
ncbi:unnamed protein product, partial [Prorocentrum cordatum]